MKSLMRRDFIIVGSITIVAIIVILQIAILIGLNSLSRDINYLERDVERGFRDVEYELSNIEYELSNVEWELSNINATLRY
jgi:hypothetical protein